MTNTDTTKMTTEADLAIVVALDAFEEKRSDAHELLIGIPCTVSINCDSYAGKVTACSKSLHTLTVTFLESGERTFRWSKKLNRYRCSRGSFYFLHLGEAVDKRDPSF